MKRWSEPSVAILLTLIIKLCELHKERWSFISFFDANTRRILRGQDVIVYDELKNSYHNFFSEVTGGLRADEIILLYADKLNAYIISNDRYREYKEDYKWLTPHSERLIKGHVMNGNLVIPKWKMGLTVNRNLSDLLKQMSAVITKVNPLTSIEAGIS